MKDWQKRFFALNSDWEEELCGHSIEGLRGALKRLGWSRDDESWAPDLQVERFVRQGAELFLIQETYFDPKVTALPKDLQALRDAIQSPPEEER